MTADFAINSTIETQLLCKCFITVDVLGISDIKKDKKNVQLESRSCLFKINCGVLVISNTTLDHSKCKHRCGSMFINSYGHAIFLANIQGGMPASCCFFIIRCYWNLYLRFLCLYWRQIVLYKIWL